MIAFLSKLIFGMALVAAVAMAMGGLEAHQSQIAALAADPKLDVTSLAMGLVLGVGIAMLARIPWLEMPKQLVRWLQVNGATFHRLAWAALFIGILLFY